MPNAKLDVLTPNVITDAPSSRPAVLATPPALAVSDAVCATLTGETAALKVALAVPGAIVREVGTVTALLLLVKVTASPPLSAAALSVTAQLSLAAPVIEVLVQVSALNRGTPLPSSPILFRDPSAEVVVRSSSPVAEPVTVGSNCRVTVAL